MAVNRAKWWDVKLVVIALGVFLLLFLFSANQNVTPKTALTSKAGNDIESNYLVQVLNFLRQPSGLGYEHTWPVSILQSSHSTMLHWLLFCIQQGYWY